MCLPAPILLGKRLSSAAIEQQIYDRYGRILRTKGRQQGRWAIRPANRKDGVRPPGAAPRSIRDVWRKQNTILLGTMFPW